MRRWWPTRILISTDPRYDREPVFGRNRRITKDGSPQFLSVCSRSVQCALAAALPAASSVQDKIKIGLAISKTGQNTPGAAATVVGNYRFSTARWRRCSRGPATRILRLPSRWKIQRALERTWKAFSAWAVGTRMRRKPQRTLSATRKPKRRRARSIREPGDLRQPANPGAGDRAGRR